MDKTIDTNELEIVDLGVASIETKGPPGGQVENIGRLPSAGISQD